jgi:Phage stabilisation protein
MKNNPMPVVGGYYADDSRSWTSQDCVNWLPTNAEKGGTRTPSELKTPPGLNEFVLTGATIPDSPVRGVYNCEGTLFAVVGNTLFKISAAGVATSIGTIAGTGRVVMSDNQISNNGNELIIVNGSSGYVYNNNTGAFTRITDAGYPGAINVVFLGSYLIQIEPARRFAFNSAPADALSYNTLDRFTSEVSPDLLMSMAVNNNELVLFSARTTEFFDVTSNAEQPIRTKGISMSRGCGGRYTVANMDNTVYWLGDDGIFYRLVGYSPQRVSTRPIEQAIKGLNWDQAYAFVWENGGHKVCYWTFPDGHTWGYDVSADEWHRRASYTFDVWRANGMAYWNGQWIAGDFQHGKLWVVDWDYVQEGDIDFTSERTTGVLSMNQNRFIISRLELIMAVGQLSDDPDHFVRIQYSDDGGYNWSDWDQEDIGATGEYGKRIVFTRQGSTYNRTYRISCSSPRRRDLLGGAIVIQGTEG